MAEAYPYEVRVDARGHYVVSGMTYDQVSEITGVSVSQLKKWGSQEGWKARRREYRDAQASIEETTVLLRAGLLKNALSTKDAQDVYAAAAMEKVAIALTKVKPGVIRQKPAPEMKFDDPESMIEALWEAIEHKAARMITSPDTMDMKQIQAGIKTWCDLKREYAANDQSGEKQKGFNADQVEMIRKALEEI